MKKTKIMFFKFFFLIIFLIFLTGCTNKKETENKEKIIQELNYLDTKIVGILNNLNNISLETYTISSEEISLKKKKEDSSSKSEENSKSSSGGEEKTSGGNNEESSDKSSNVKITQMERESMIDLDENDVNWQEIKEEIELINESWGAIIIDLTSVNANNDDILNFSEILNNSILSIREENKKSTLTNVANLYLYIPKFQRSLEGDSTNQNIKQVKSYIINAYSLIEQDDWTAVEKNIKDAEETFKNIMGNIEYIKTKEYKVNNTYVLIGELKNSLKYKDKKLFYIKYKNLIESINTL